MQSMVWASLRPALSRRDRLVSDNKGNELDVWKPPSGSRKMSKLVEGRKTDPFICKY